MKLHTISIQHYKSLSHVTVELDEQITVIVGPNSVGKTNFVSAMDFLRDAARDGLDHAVTSRGGITRVRQQVTGIKPFNLKFSLEFRQTIKGQAEATPSSYELDIANVKGGDFKISQESGHCVNTIIKETVHDVFEEVEFQDTFSRTDDGHVLVNQKSVHLLREYDRMILGLTADFDSYPYSICAPMKEHMKSWRFTTLYPTTLRELRAPDTETSLREDGSNWASMIRAAKRTPKGRQTLERINEMMRLVLPDFQDVQVSTVGSYLVPKFRFEDTANGKAREFDPVQLSDGTLRIYGILLSLYLQPAPSLLVIEEPEQTVHPGVLAMLSEAFKEVAATVQIIITTHSPQLVDHFAPEQVRVASMDNGLTQIAPLKQSQRLAVQRGLMGLGEFMAAEGLQPELQQS